MKFPALRGSRSNIHSNKKNKNHKKGTNTSNQNQIEYDPKSHLLPHIPKSSNSSSLKRKPSNRYSVSIPRFFYIACFVIFFITFSFTTETSIYKFVFQNRKNRPSDNQGVHHFSHDVKNRNLYSHHNLHYQKLHSIHDKRDKLENKGGGDITENRKDIFETFDQPDQKIDKLEKIEADDIIIENRRDTFQSANKPDQKTDNLGNKGGDDIIIENLQTADQPDQKDDLSVLTNNHFSIAADFVEESKVESHAQPQDKSVRNGSYLRKTEYANMDVQDQIQKYGSKNTKKQTSVDTAKQNVKQHSINDEKLSHESNHFSHHHNHHHHGEQSELQKEGHKIIEESDKSNKSKHASVSDTIKTKSKCVKSMADLTRAERFPTIGERHMVQPPSDSDGKITLVCCETTAGSLSIAVHSNWAQLGSDRFLNMVESNYFSSKVPLMRCIHNFICQFGIAGDPIINKKFKTSIEDDRNWLPEGPDYRENSSGIKRFSKGYMAFAGSGPNSRSNQFIVALGNNKFLGGGSPWEVPWGEVVGEESYNTLDKIYTGYGDKGPSQGRLAREGASTAITEEFPELDYVTSCNVIEGIES